MTDHAEITQQTDATVYLRDPHNPWQHCSNEKTNGLIRQYFPKGKDLLVRSQADLDAIAYKFNIQPRTHFDFRCLVEVIIDVVLSTHTNEEQKH